MIDPEIRKSGIGCSEIAAALGKSRWKSTWSLVYEKRGLLISSPGQAESWKVWGGIMEPSILAWTAGELGKKLTVDHVTRRHPDLPIVYTPDALVEGESAGVDAKNVGFRHAEDWAEGPPPDAYFQAHGYMLCMDLERYYLAASICGAAPKIFPVERDPELEAVIARRVTNLWNRFIAGDEELPLDGSADAAAWLQNRYPTHKRPDLREATRQEAALLEEYVDVRICAKQLEERRNTLENQLKNAIANREGLRWDGGRFTWRKSKDSRITDWESMAIGLRQKFIADQKDRDEWERFYTRTKESSRRIYLKSPRYKEAAEDAE
jgi:predicted phage-related endonuclease